jgi:tRNA-2-methylthio-N6-dimethylallyladenosine synthase
MAQKDQGVIQQRAPYVDVVFGTHNVGNAAKLLRRAELEGPLMEILAESDEFPSALPVRRDVAYSAWVTIQIGCNNTCAFCIVPSVRGKEISRPFEELVDEVRALADQGATEVTLLGQNVNSYGRDITKRRPLFADLLRAVGAVDGIRRVRYTSPHPKDLRPETIAAMAEAPAVCEHLHYPLQSGSDPVLKAMHRGYTSERYLRQLAAARVAVPDLAVTTDIIVGFPGETDDDFDRTLQVAATAEFDSAYTFIFSPRPGTEAAAWTDRLVDPEVIAERFERLRVVVERSALAKHQARIGLTEEVLVEGPSKKDPATSTGRTRQNKLVHFATVDAALSPGTYANVRITAAAPHHLKGELVDVTARPRHRSRIPLAVL